VKEFKERRVRNARRSGAFAIYLLPASQGFWLMIRSRQQVHYRIKYLAIGSAGHQRKAETRGRTSKSDFRRFIHLGFNVIMAGITSAALSLGKAAAGTLIRLPVVTPEGLTYSPIRHAALAGGATVPRRRRKGQRQTRGQYEDSYDLYGLYGAYLPTVAYIHPRSRRRRAPFRKGKRLRNRGTTRRKK